MIGVINSRVRWIFFLNYSQCCWLLNWCGARTRTRFIIHCPPPSGGSFFYVGADTFRILFWWTCYAADIVSHFLKSFYSHIWGERVIWVTPFFLWDQFDQKMKKMNFSTIRVEQGGERWTNTKQCIFCILVAYLLVSELMFHSRNY